MNKKQSNDGHFYMGVFTGMLIGMVITGSLSFISSDAVMIIISVLMFATLRGFVYKNLRARGVSMEAVMKQREEYRKSDLVGRDNE